MKKTYIAPAQKVVKLDTVKVLAQSGVFSQFGSGIDFGGIDTGGTIVPSVKPNNGQLDNALFGE